MSTSEIHAVLFPHLADLLIEGVSLRGRSVRIQASTRELEAVCPGCEFGSRRVHSRYERRVSDPMISGQKTTIHLRVRRFFCDNPGCAKKTFVEQVPGLTFRHGRCSVLLRETLQVIALALGGRAGARLAGRLAVWISRMTLLRLVRGLPEPVVPNVRVLGVDDFALRRGHIYGTVLIDLDTGRPIDVLPDREADSFADWLDAHPGVEVICRDRAGCYADGAARGAPTAIQVADRFHLLQNLTDAVKRAVARHRRCLQPEPEPAQPASSAEENIDTVEGPRAARTRDRHAEVHALISKGLSPSAVARALRLDPKTVRRFALAATADELIGANPTGRDSMLNTYKPYLRQRWSEGCTSTSRLYAEIRERGFRGSMRTLRRWLIRLRAAVTEPDIPPAIKPRQVIGWIISRPEKLTDDDHTRLEEICDRCEELAVTRDLTRSFAQLLRERRGPDLEVWVKEAENGPVQELRGFASGLRKDWDAVTNGLTLHHSSGPVEGHVNRIKMLKRQMYGRANPDLLRKRILFAA